ncbi:carboxypeptidase-like regulatory domain-containing protein [Spongiimicrobium sp. 3-5]|uniref:carboxypeptidase-like regulatory domain-containing protein n=1 Tax=Spongiimicrobium sp. 3-5 TaxID=3332596 RepID=UPI0039814A88
MRKNIWCFLFLLVASPLFSQNSNVKLREIRGGVSDYGDPIAGVTVTVKDTERKTRTDALGNFVIWAKNDEVLVFSYKGRNGAASVINSRTSYLNITMPIATSNLDEIVLENEEDSKRKQDKNRKTRLSGIFFGTLDPEKIGFGVKQIKDDQISNISGSILDAINGRFAGVTVVGFGNDASATLRGKPLSWDVDGLLYSPSNPPNHININDVKSITVMPGSWSQARYGLVAPWGIIIVRTVGQSLQYSNTEGFQNFDAAQVQGNIYNNEATTRNSGLGVAPKYIQRLQVAGSPRLAYEVYLEQKNIYGGMPHFFADVHHFFLSDYKDKRTANKVLEDMKETFKEDISALRILAYLLEERAHFKESHAIYRMIITLKPFQYQAIRDFANSYVQIGEHKRAWYLYRYYLNKRGSQLANEGVDKIIKEEMLQLMGDHGKKLGLAAASYSLNSKEDDISMVLEWNNPNAEFEIQFVNPEKRFYTWKHSYDQNRELLLDEKFSGYSSRFFSIQDIDKGQWLVNITYNGNQENTPTYLKTTIRNNNTSEETIKILKLDHKNVNYNFLQVSSNNVISLSK